MGRYNLLCNSCNWEFVGFAVPGTVPEGNRKRVKASAEDIKFTPLEYASETKEVAENIELSETITSSENSEIEAADKSNEDFEPDAGKNSSIDTVLIAEESEETKPQTITKRHGEVKSTAE